MNNSVEKFYFHKKHIDSRIACVVAEFNTAIMRHVKFKGHVKDAIIIYLWKTVKIKITHDFNIIKAHEIVACCLMFRKLYARVKIQNWFCRIKTYVV